MSIRPELLKIVAEESVRLLSVPCELKIVPSVDSWLRENLPGKYKSPSYKHGLHLRSKSGRCVLVVGEDLIPIGDDHFAVKQVIAHEAAHCVSKSSDHDSELYKSALQICCQMLRIGVPKWIQEGRKFSERRSKTPL